MPILKVKDNGEWKEIGEGSFVDSTLTVSGASADAKVTGDYIQELSIGLGTTNSVLDQIAQEFSAGIANCLPLSGGTLTGNISYYNAGSPYEMIKFLTGDVNGAGIVIGAGGLTVIGAGESASALVTAASLGGATEDMHITSDQAIYFHTNCQSIGSRKTVSINTSGAFSGTIPWDNVTGKPSSFTPASHTHDYLPLSGGTMSSYAALKFPASPGTVSVDEPMSITYGGIGAYGTFRINADTDGSGNEYLVLTSGKGLSSSTADGLAIGSSTLTWQGSTVITSGNIGSQTVNYANYAGSASSADKIKGVYTGSGGSQGPSYIGTYAIKCNMMNQFLGTGVGFSDYADVLMMNAYGWADVPYATAIAVQKTSGIPRAWIAAGGNSSNWGGATELVTMNHMAWKKLAVTTSAGEADISCSGVTTSSTVIATRNCTSSGGNYAQLIGGCYSNGYVHIGNVAGSTLGANTHNVSVWWSK